MKDEQNGAKMEAARTCVHCKTPRSAHQQRKCLFDSTDFKPMTLEEWVAFELSQRTRGFMTYEAPGMAIANMRAVQKLEFMEDVSFEIKVESSDEKK